MIRIAVDGNGGDYGLDTTVLGSMMAIKKFPNIEITIYMIIYMSFIIVFFFILECSIILFISST